MMICGVNVFGFSEEELRKIVGGRPLSDFVKNSVEKALYLRTQLRESFPESNAIEIETLEANFSSFFEKDASCNQKRTSFSISMFNDCYSCEIGFSCLHEEGSIESGDAFEEFAYLSYSSYAYQRGENPFSYVARIGDYKNYVSKTRNLGRGTNPFPAGYPKLES